MSAPEISVPAAAPGSMPNTGRWGWYKDHEGNEFKRVSTLIKEVETDTYNLDVWKQRQVALGLAKRDDLMLSVKAMGQQPEEPLAAKDFKSKLNGIVKEASEAAKTGKGGARSGTAVHDLTERLDRGEPIETIAAGLPATHGTTIRAYAALRQLNGWRSVEIERTVICEGLGPVGGTFDRIDVVPGLTELLGPWICQHGHDHGADESAVIDDVKTEESPWRNGLHIGPQLAIYSRALRMWLPTPEYVPTPCVRQDVGIVVHVRDGRAVPYLINLTEGWEAAQAAYAQAERKARAKVSLGTPGAWFATLPGVREPEPVQMLVEHAVAERYADPARPGPGQVGEVVTVAGVDFTRLQSTEDAIARGFAAPVSAPAEQVAVRGDDGMVRWTDAAAEDFIANGNPPEETAALRAKLPPGVYDRMRLAAETTALIEAIWRAQTVDALSVLWRIAGDREVPWTGPVAMAGDARRRQIECPQRALHTGSGKCACGWCPPLPA